MGPESPDLQEIHDFLIELARKAGEMIMHATSLDVAGLDSKKNSVDLVTETDRLVEETISATLAHRYPNFDFLGEETSASNPLTDSPTFILDPIDGTTNFVHRHPYVSISLGFSMNQLPVIGVVFNPFTSLLYTGIKGQGSYLTVLDNSNSHNKPTSLESMLEQRRLPLMPDSPIKGLSSCLVAVEWGSDRSGQNMDCKLATFANLAKSKDEGGAMVHSLRSLGSAALNLCAVAAGHIDVYWEGGCFAWDVCAGWCILSEAGGVVVDANPGGWRIGLDQRRYLAVRGDGEEKSEEEKGLKLSVGQKGLVEELWACVPKEGFDYEAPR